MTNTNKKSTSEELREFFKKDDPKRLMILNAIIALLWVLNAALSFHNVVVYDRSRWSLYFDGFLALFYIGMTFGYACKYAKAKKEKAIK